MNQGPYLCCFWTKLSHLQLHTTLLQYQCLCNAYAKFYWNSSIHSKDIDQKCILDIIKGHNSVVSEWNYPTCNPISLLSDTNVYAKFEENRKKGTKVSTQKRSAKHFWHTSRAITLLFQNKIRAVAGQRSSPELSFANKTKMFFRAKNKRRKITGPWNIGHCDLNLFWGQRHIFQKYDIHPSNII